MKRAEMFIVALGALAACSKQDDPKSVPSAHATAVKARDQQSAQVQGPAPSSSQMDPLHSSVLFKVHHLGAGSVYGWFKEFSGTFVVGVNSTQSLVAVVVKTATVDTRDDERSGNLTGPNLLPVLLLVLASAAAPLLASGQRRRRTIAAISVAIVLAAAAALWARG